MYLSRQLYEEALHVQFYLTLLDTYVPDPDERFRAFAAVENIPSIRREGRVLLRWIDSIQALDRASTAATHRRQFLLNLICFAACIEGLFFFAAFAYVYFLRSRGLLHGLAGGTNWVFRDESAHMAFAFEVVDARCAARSPSSSTPRSKREVRRDDRRGDRLRDPVRRGPARRAVSPGSRFGTCASTSSSAPTSGSRRSACRSATAPKNPFAVHGSAGRPGGHELLRATRLRLPGRRDRRGRVRRGVLGRVPLPGRRVSGSAPS